MHGKVGLLVLILMNILRLVAAEKEKKGRPNPEFEKLEKQASSKDHGECPMKFEKQELKQRLEPVQFHVTQEKGTERPFSGKYLRMKEDGLYTCVVCDNPLFKSDHKYVSGCGWPSFNDVIAQGKVTLKKDTSHGIVRTEVVCSRCGAHLGHVFEDGPAPTYLRYCINSAALNFIPKKDLKQREIDINDGDHVTSNCRDVNDNEDIDGSDLEDNSSKDVSDDGNYINDNDNNEKNSESVPDQNNNLESRDEL